MGKLILMLLLQTQKSAQGRISETSDIDNFRLAVVLFKEHGISIPANEYLLILQLLRQV